MAKSTAVAPGLNLRQPQVTSKAQLQRSPARVKDGCSDHEPAGGGRRGPGVKIDLTQLGHVIFLTCGLAAISALRCFCLCFLFFH